MSYQVKYFAADGKPAIRETHSNGTAAHWAAGHQSIRTGSKHWVEVDGTVCQDCEEAYVVAKGKAEAKAEKVPGLGASILRPYIPGTAWNWNSAPGFDKNKNRKRR